MKLLTTFLIIFSKFETKNSSKGEPARLGKRDNTSKFNQTCERIAPYVLLIALALLFILLLVILVKYGANFTGTEQNAYYYHMDI